MSVLRRDKKDEGLNVTGLVTVDSAAGGHIMLPDGSVYNEHVSAGSGFLRAGDYLYQQAVRVAYGESDEDCTAYLTVPRTLFVAQSNCVIKDWGVGCVVAPTSLETVYAKLWRIGTGEASDTPYPTLNAAGGAYQVRHGTLVDDELVEGDMLVTRIYEGAGAGSKPKGVFVFVRVEQEPWPDDG